jgi:hypothetical protein
MTWLAVVLVASAVSPAAAATLLLIVGLAAAVYLIVLLARAVRGLPEFVRQLRRIGDPDAWRGIERG